MTEIYLKQNKTETQLAILGHCNAGRINGMDPCCCAVSMLVHTLLETLGKLNLKNYKGKCGGGWCSVRFWNRGRDARKAKLALDTVMNGFRLLSQAYPQNVRITCKGGKNI